jgi:hypothetical protein
MIIDYVCQDISNVLCQQQAVLDLKITDFWDVTVLYKHKQHFQETNCPHLQVERLKFYVTLKMQAVGLSLILVRFHWTVYCSVFVLTAIKTSNLAVFRHSHTVQGRHLTELPELVQCRFCVVSHAFLCISKLIMPRYMPPSVFVRFERCTTEYFHTINEKVGFSQKIVPVRRMRQFTGYRMCQDIYES